MERSTIFAGFGGQGILFAGTVLARAAMAEGLQVLWIPSYGPEMRGGTASCTVIVGDEAIGSPVVDQADAVVALNPPSLAKFESIVVEGGLLVLNRSLIEALPTRDDIEIASIPCTALAKTAGDDRLVSVVALGALLARRPIVSLEAMRHAIEDVVSTKRPEILEIDLLAFGGGYEAGSKADAAGLIALRTS
jgi:2-oxoglutarate ferredoxin oxidoreductase subunit gamma